MSEYQYVGFRVIDGTVSEENLEFMQRQSTRAELTSRSFDNEYHYGDFHGNAAEMLRRGYDIHLHYANYGVRKLMIRLPDGLPNPETSEKYLEQDGLSFLKDTQGPGGILCIRPFIESGELDALRGVKSFLDRLLPLRDEILSGDLRPLYIAHLAVAGDGNHDPDEEKDAPVPAGLNKLTKAQLALAELYGIDDSLIAAAAQHCPPMPERRDPLGQYIAWLKKQPAAIKNAWLAQLMAEPDSAVRREILAKFQKSERTADWPTVQNNRTMTALRAAADVIHASTKTRESRKGRA